MSTGFIFLGLGCYVLTLCIIYEVIKLAIKDALRDLKAAEKAAAKKEAQEMLNAKIQD